jgi:hypothetical protein
VGGDPVKKILWSLLLVGLVACGGDAADTDEDGKGGKADENGSGGIAEALEGREDPVANYLRGVAGDDGIVPGTYQDVLDGVGEQLGCDASSQKTFVILLTKADLFPRTMFTVCSDDPKAASQFFLSTQSEVGDGIDVDPRNIRMFAWDADARMYRTYEMTPNGAAGEGMKLDIEPARCRSCHTGPADTDSSAIPFSPVMNELVNPWTLWNAEPDFRSHQFEDAIDPDIARARVYKEMLDGRLDSAANFERHIRAGMERVTTARMRTRRDDANLAQSLALLRPMFCDETLNYVSENHNTGDTHASAAIDDAIRRLYLTIRGDNWPYDFINDGKLRLPVPEAGQEPVAVIPVRGEATIQVELSLVSRRVLTVEQALRVRALDWKRPALSEFRCGLFEDAEARLVVSPPDMAAYPRNSDLIPALYDEIMGQIAPDGGDLVSIPDASSEASLEALAGGDLSSYTRTTDEFADELEAWFDELQEPGGRAWLEAQRVERGCVARARFSAAPYIPGTESCESGD